MTALNKYVRLEATGLWRATPDAQRREVFVAMGDASLTIADMSERVLAHWSLAAIERANPGAWPALYHPDGDPGETLELEHGETEMVEALETLRRAVSRARPRPGRLRGLGFALSILSVAALAVFWLPGAMQDHTLTVVPKVKRAALGAALLKRIERVSGAACKDPAGRAALARLGARLEAGPLAVLPSMTRPSLHLPGRMIVLDRRVIEESEEPDVVAGYILAEQTLGTQSDPLRDLLRVAGLWENMRLLTTGEVAPEALDAYAEHLMRTPQPTPAAAPLLARFAKLQVRSTPYAYARDGTGETVLDLIEADPMNGKATAPLISDADWLRLQGVCGG